MMMGGHSSPLQGLILGQNHPEIQQDMTAVMPRPWGAGGAIHFDWHLTSIQKTTWCAQLKAHGACFQMNS